VEKKIFTMKRRFEFAQKSFEYEEFNARESEKIISFKANLAIELA